MRDHPATLAKPNRTAATRVIQAAVPGKVMLAGEYSVLWGGPFLAATVDRALGVTVSLAARGSEPRSTWAVMSSALWPTPRRLSTDPATWPAADAEEGPLVGAVAHGLGLLRQDGWLPGDDHLVNVQVDASLDPKAGLGSSSALRLGVLLALLTLREDSPDAGRACRAAREAFALQRAAQGQASGYDLLTQTTGGLVLGRAGAAAFSPSAESTPWARSLGSAALARLGGAIELWVGGVGAPTGPTMSRTLAWLEATSRRELLGDANATLVAAFADFATGSAPLSAVARACHDQQAVLADAPGMPLALLTATTAAVGQGRSDFAIKTTGAGGEDALLLIGAAASRSLAGAYLHAAGWHPLGSPLTDQWARAWLSPSLEITHHGLS